MKNIERIIQKNNLGPGQIVKFYNDAEEYTTKNISTNRREIFVTNKEGDVRCKRISNIVSLNRKPILTEAIVYKPTEIKEILWNTFKDKASNIVFNGKEGEEKYAYTITLESNFTLDDATSILEELFDTDMFDVTVLGNNKILVEFLNSTLLTEEVKIEEKELERLAKKYHTDIKYIKKQIEAGEKVEREHKSTIEWLKKYYQDNNEFPPDEEIFDHISVNHIDELKDYYILLKKMENKVEKKELKEDSSPLLKNSIPVNLPDDTYYGVWKGCEIILPEDKVVETTMGCKGKCKVRLDVKDNQGLLYGVTLNEADDDEVLSPQVDKIEKDNVYIQFRKELESIVNSLEELYLNEDFLKFTNKDTGMGKALATILNTSKQVRDGVDSAVSLTESTKRVIKEVTSPLIEEVFNKERIQDYIENLQQYREKSSGSYFLASLQKFLKSLLEIVPLVRLGMMRENKEITSPFTSDGNQVREKDNDNTNDVEKELLMDKQKIEEEYQDYSGLSFSKEDVESAVESLYTIKDKTRDMLVIDVPNKFRSDATQRTNYEVVIYYNDNYIAVYPQIEDKDGTSIAEATENQILGCLKGMNTFAGKNIGIVTEDIQVSSEDWQERADKIANDFILKTFGKHDEIQIQVLSADITGESIESEIEKITSQEENSVEVTREHEYKVKTAQGEQTNITITVEENYNIKWEETSDRGVSVSTPYETLSWRSWKNIMLEGQYVTLIPEAKQLLNKAFNYRREVNRNK